MTKIRDLTDISAEELRRAVSEMYKGLNIPGSIAPIYDLYAACFQEREKAIQRKKEAK